MRMFLLVWLLCQAEFFYAQNPNPRGDNSAIFFYVPRIGATQQESEKTSKNLEEIAKVLANGYKINSLFVENTTKNKLLEMVDNHTRNYGPNDQVFFIFL